MHERRPPRPNKGYAEDETDRFNREVLTGTEVLYWPSLPEHPGDTPLRTRTSSPAWRLGHGAGVVSVEGKTGGVSIAHVEVVR